MSWKDQGQTGAWSDPEAQVEWEYGEPLPKKSQQKENVQQDTHLLTYCVMFQFIVINMH